MSLHPFVHPSVQDYARYHTCDQHQAWDEIRGAMAAVVRKLLWFGTGCCRLLHEKMAAVGGRPCCEPRLCWSHSRWGWIPTMLDIVVYCPRIPMFSSTPPLSRSYGWRLFGAYWYHARWKRCELSSLEHLPRPAWKIRQSSRPKGRKPTGFSCNAHIGN